MWVNTSKTVNINTKEDNMSDRPVVTATKQTIAAVKTMVEEDGGYTVSEIAHGVDISAGTYNVHTAF